MIEFENSFLWYHPRGQHLVLNTNELQENNYRLIVMNCLYKKSLSLNALVFKTLICWIIKIDNRRGSTCRVKTHPH